MMRTPIAAPVRDFVEPRTQIVRGQTAQDCLDSAAFRDAWDALCAACSWTTVFQTPPFVTTWYRVYAARYEPLLVCGWGHDGALVGLLPLAIAREGKRIVAAGSYQAEYQTWISDADVDPDFPATAFRMLADRFPRHVVTLQYVPSGAAIDAFEGNGPLAPYAVVDVVRRGLMDVLTGDHEESLRKKGNRSRLKRLERLGPVTLDRITRVEDFDALLERFSAYCDLRQGAAHGGLPFRDDPLHGALYRALFEVPGMLDVSALRCGSESVSAHINVRNRDTVMLGVVAHAPFAAEHSPGKFHTLMLARHLAAEGCEAFDLTPGGDAYKDRFATRFDEVRTLRIFPSRAARARFLLARSLRARARSEIRRAGLESRARTLHGAISETLATRNGSVAVAFTRAARGWVGRRESLKLYLVPFRSTVGTAADPAIRTDCVEDLLLYVPQGRRSQTKRGFLSLALRRLEAGHHCHTLVESGALRAVWWSTSVHAEASLDDPWGTIHTGAGMLIHDVRIWPPAAQDVATETRAVIERILASAAAGEHDRLLIAVEASDADLDRAIGHRAGPPIASWHAEWRRGRVISNTARPTTPSAPGSAIAPTSEPTSPMRSAVGAMGS